MQSAGGFQVDAASQAEAAAPATAIGGTGSVGSLLSLQAVGEAGDGRRRRATRRAHDALDQMQAIRLGLLDGMPSEARADSLAATLAPLVPTGDADLDATLAQIDLRARVELAKLGRYPD